MNGKRAGRHRQRHGGRAARRGRAGSRRRRRFQITVFGDEPCGNYNRILLSGVLAGSHDPSDIFLNPLVVVRGQWRHASCGRARRVRSIVAARQRDAARTASSSRTTRSSSPRAAGRWCRRSTACRRARRAAERTWFQGRRLRLPHAGGLRPHPRARAHASRAAVIGGGLLGLEAAQGLLNGRSRFTSST